ncbi:ROK family protein [bacterium]|nr:ROK family protein [bacterium]
MHIKKVIALDIGGTNIRGALVDKEGNISNWFERKTPKDVNSEAIFESICATIDNVKENRAEDIMGIGIGVAGLISHKEGIVRNSPNITSWHDEPLKREIEDRYDIPVEIDNDSNLAGYGEAYFGAGKGVSTLVMLTLGTGLGGGIIIYGKIFRGKDNSAAEIGHITVEAFGLQCICGNRGCLEAYVSSKGIIGRTRNLLKSGVDSRLNNCAKYDVDSLTTLDICNEAMKGDKLSRDILDETGVYLGVGMSSLINLLNPDMIVIGGRIAECSFDFVNIGIEEARKRTYGELSRMPLITKAKLGDRAGILGAGKLVFDYVG